MAHLRSTPQGVLVFPLLFSLSASLPPSPSPRPHPTPPSPAQERRPREAVQLRVLTPDIAPLSVCGCQFVLVRRVGRGGGGGGANVFLSARRNVPTQQAQKPKCLRNAQHAARHQTKQRQKPIKSSPIPRALAIINLIKLRNASDLPKDKCGSYCQRKRAPNGALNEQNRVEVAPYWRVALKKRRRRGGEYIVVRQGLPAGGAA